MRILILLFFCKIGLGAIQFTITNTDCSGAGVFQACSDVDSGGLCAFAADANKTWCCPAENDVCWDWGEGCTGVNNVAGNGQTLCTNLGVTWCCNAEYELCTNLTWQYNICIAKFQNPYASIPTAVALAMESSYFATTTSQSTSKTFSAISTTSSSPISQNTMSSSTLTSTATSASTSSIASGSSTASISTKTRSPGATAGIAIGAIAGAAFVAIAFFLIGRHFTHKSSKRTPDGTLPPGSNFYAEPQGQRVHQYGYGIKSELPGSGTHGPIAEWGGTHNESELP